MADAKALFAASIKELSRLNSLTPESSDSSIKAMADLYSTCMLVAEFKNSRDAICQSIDALTAAIKESGQ